MPDDDQPDMFDLPGGKADRDDAIEAVGEAADEEWKGEAERALLRVCLKLAEFTVDEVWAEMAPGYETHEHRAMGNIMQAGRKAGWCEPTEATQACKRRKRHAGKVTVWRSLL